MSTEDVLRRVALTYFDRVGFAAATKPLSYNAYEEWLLGGHHGRMEYLQRHAAKKADPSLLLSGARSWICLLLNYDTQEPLSTELREQFYQDRKGWIARYARGGDYHVEIEKRHSEMMRELESMFPGEKFLSCVDTKAVLERDTAARAGLGWIGKNTCLINQEMGSFVFISEILTTLELPVASTMVADHCGTCTRCLDACPTGALVAPRKLDATKCISYWTIEVSKETPPPELASRFGYNFFGCDICQDVCPWNSKARKRFDGGQARISHGLVDPLEIMALTDDDLKARTKNSAISRAKPNHLKSNAETLLKNLSRKEK